MSRLRFHEPKAFVLKKEQKVLVSIDNLDILEVV
jgi:hypothetical protein